MYKSTKTAIPILQFEKSTPKKIAAKTFTSGKCAPLKLSLGTGGTFTFLPEICSALATGLRIPSSSGGGIALLLLLLFPVFPPEEPGGAAPEPRRDWDVVDERLAMLLPLDSLRNPPP